MIGVLIADDHEIVRRGLRMTIAGEADMQLLGEACTGKQALEMGIALKPQVILLDIQMPEMDGIAATAALHASQPQIAILMLSSYSNDTQLHAALQAGASGYLLKDVSGDDLVAAIRGAAQGNPQLHPQIARRLMQKMPAPKTPFSDLTQRELNVLRLITRGLSNKEIGLALSLTEVTVKGYVTTLLSK